MAKIRLKGHMPRLEGTKNQQVFWNKEILERLENEIDFDSVSSLVNFLALHYLGDVNLNKEKTINVKEYFLSEDE